MKYGALSEGQSSKADATYARGNSRTNARNDRNYFDQWTRKYRRDDVRKRESALYEQIGKLQVELEWIKKKSAGLD